LQHIVPFFIHLSVGAFECLRSCLKLALEDVLHPVGHGGKSPGAEEDCRQ
jgi:hypothetical protein